MSEFWATETPAMAVGRIDRLLMRTIDKTGRAAHRRAASAVRARLVNPIGPLNRYEWAVELEADEAVMESTREALRRARP